MIHRGASECYVGEGVPSLSSLFSLACTKGGSMVRTKWQVRPGIHGHFLEGKNIWSFVGMEANLWSNLSFSDPLSLPGWS